MEDEQKSTEPTDDDRGPEAEFRMKETEGGNDSKSMELMCSTRNSELSNNISIGDLQANDADTVLNDVRTINSTVEIEGLLQKRKSNVELLELHESERMLFFTDAVFAIAVTLLILPIMDAVVEFGGGNEEEGEEEKKEEEKEPTAWNFFNNRVRYQLYAFVLSFSTITSLWKKHVFLFAYVERIGSNALIVANALWILTIVLIPVVTNYLFRPQFAYGYLIYFCVIEGNYIITAAMALLIRKYPRAHNIQDNYPTTYSIKKDFARIGMGAISAVIGGTASGNWGAIGFIPPFLLDPCLWIASHFKKIEFGMSPQDEMTKYYGEPDTAWIIIIYVVRRLYSIIVSCSCQQSHSDEGILESETFINAHSKLFSHISERLIVFTDAAVAISMTLFMIPLLGKTSNEPEALSDFILDVVDLLFGFVLSFIIIFLYWKEHDHIYAFVDGRIPPSFFTMSMPWILSIILMPVSMVLLTSNVFNWSDWSSWQMSQFIVVLLFNRIFSAVLLFIVFKDGRGLTSNHLVRPLLGILVGIFALLFSYLFSGGDARYLIFMFALPYPISYVILKFWPGFGNVVAKLG